MAWRFTPRQAALLLTVARRRQGRDFALNIAAINLGFAGQQRNIDAALRKFDE